ncbi:PHP domain-containing protein, partial [Streptomyces sp. NPDC005899]|uniref:PHP domain-containing protein n=1 Tax=Streptomyces sp. NPDC005899 TaxID=3155716 RepID=UPI0033DAA4B7
MSGFTHLHTVSGFSLRYGASHPERLVERAVERGMDALALTDRDSLAGAVRFARACGKAGIRPLFGVELAVAPPALAGGRTHRSRTPVRGGAFVDESAPRATFLARDGKPTLVKPEHINLGLAIDLVKPNGDRQL